MASEIQPKLSSNAFKIKIDFITLSSAYSISGHSKTMALLQNNRKLDEWPRLKQEFLMNAIIHPCTDRLHSSLTFGSTSPNRYAIPHPHYSKYSRHSCSFAIDYCPRVGLRKYLHIIAAMNTARAQKP